MLKASGAKASGAFCVRAWRRILESMKELIAEGLADMAETMGKPGVGSTVAVFYGEEDARDYGWVVIGTLRDYNAVADTDFDGRGRRWSKAYTLLVSKSQEDKMAVYEKWVRKGNKVRVFGVTCILDEVNEAYVADGVTLMTLRILV